MWDWMQFTRHELNMFVLYTQIVFRSASLRYISSYWSQQKKHTIVSATYVKIKIVIFTV